ncbi:MFS transporter [Pantoea coffeiphila]|uniref:MFS transporter n=1 Tax=Pantoea coffeiphila TaxID=1465635 RepID=UPI00196143FF|nr:MFS transporter [Pantoea coffeiphila]MBM7342784.1 putative MFS family arabinose efflux permease [Pantoea coffeiphila]
MKKHNISMWGAIFLLGALYGICIGFTASGLPVIGRQQGWSLEAIGLLALPFLPMGLVFLWAPKLDKPCEKYDRRRRWMQRGMMGVLAGLLLASQCAGHLVGLAMALLLISTSVATLTLSFNALLIERLANHQLPRAKSLQMSGYFLGEATGGGLLLIFYPLLGWERMFFLIMLLFSGGFLLVCLLPSPQQKKHLPSTPRIRHFFRHPMAWRRLGWVLMLALSCSIGNNMLRPFMIDYGFSITAVGAIMGIVASVAGALGALLIGLLLSLWGLRRTMCIILLLMVADGALLGTVVSYGEHAFAITAVLAIVGNVLFSAFFVTLTVQAMRWAGGDQPGTDYSLFECMAFIAGIVGSGVAGALAGAAGFGHFFLLWALLLFLALLLAVPLHRRIQNAEAAI